MSIETNMNEEIPQNALSVYRQDNGIDDFPVLKAFQQYIDAEQSKARKRMVSLCIFFGVLMTVLIAVFMFMLREITVRNQELNDRLVEYAMRDRTQPVVVPQPQPQPQQQVIVPNNSANEAAMRAMTETLVALQKKIAEQPQATVAPAAAPAPEPQLTEEERELERKTRTAEEKLKKARAILEAEKKKLAEEREKFRQEKVEQHRRRLYPEYYGEQAVEQAAVKPPAQPVAPSQPVAPKQLSDDDIADILREADAHISGNAGDEEETLDDDIEDAIEYFQDDEYQIPVEVKGTSTKWHVPLD